MTAAILHLVKKLGSELELLSPTLQALFLQDPISFVQSNNMPPEVKALLDAQVPISTSISASAQLRPWKKLSFNPNFSFARTSDGKIIHGRRLLDTRWRIRCALRLISTLA